MSGKLSEALKRRILTIDIERLPGLAPVWDQKTRYLPAARWRRLPSLLCYSARWYGQKRFMFDAAWNDYDTMVRSSWELYDQADIVLTFNGVRFDNKHLRGAWLVAGLPQPRPWKDVDLFAVSSRLFGFESKSLDHLCARLGLPTKSDRYDDLVAEAALEGDRAAQRKMRAYNQNDVAITENCYESLLPWISNHPHVNVTSNERTCNRCGSKDLTALPSPYLAVQLEYAMYRCDSCSGIVRDTTNLRRVARTHGVK